MILKHLYLYLLDTIEKNESVFVVMSNYTHIFPVTILTAKSWIPLLLVAYAPRFFVLYDWNF